MRASPILRPRQTVLLIALVLLCASCSRTKYRLSADREAYTTIAERNGDPRWAVADVGIDIDPRSRYFDSYSPDCSPMPTDDPTAHRYMQCVDGKTGWEHWLDNGVRPELENPQWKQKLGEYVDLTADGAVELNVDSALRLAYVHSPNHQLQLETLYLSSLDVTTERFRLDTQFFGGYDIAYRHNGDLVPASLAFDSGSGQYVITAPFEGVEANRLTVGRPSLGDPALQTSRRFATAGQLLTGFANSFVFEFTGPDTGLSASLLNFTFLQPLLRGAGRDVALEALTFSERNLLANLRAYGQFRQGFFTQIAVGEQGVGGPLRRGRGTSLQIFSGQAGVGGYVGLLQQLQQIRNAEDNLDLQIRTLRQLESNNEIGLIDPIQVEQFRQNVERDRASLLQSRNDFERLLDTYKTSALGLPPDLAVNLDDTLIKQFQFVDREATNVLNTVANLQDRLGNQVTAADERSESYEAVLASVQPDVFDMVARLRDLIDATLRDAEALQAPAAERLKSMSADEKLLFEGDLAQLEKDLIDLEERFASIQSNVARLQEKQTDPQRTDQLPQEKDDTVNLIQEMLRLVRAATLAQAKSRLETVRIEPVDLRPHDAFNMALQNRLDFMNGRAALVDSWRLIQVNADALQSILDLSAAGDVRTARNNPLSFRGATTNFRMGLQFDAPFTRLVERNNYRESLINYQRDRRAFIQSRDALHLDLRVLLRQLEQLRLSLEIQRRSVAIAIRRVDLTRAALYEPVAPAAPGQRSVPFGPTAAINLLSAQSALRDTQNAFLNAWLGYYAARMRLARELGLMQLDSEGRWIETPPPKSSFFPAGDEATPYDSEGMNDGAEEIPPPVPTALLDAVNSLPDDFHFEAPDLSRLVGDTPQAGAPPGVTLELSEVPPFVPPERR